MKRIATVLGAVLGLLLCALVIVVAVALRIIYETVMLPVRVWRAECGIGWAEHVLAEDLERESAPAHHPV